MQSKFVASIGVVLIVLGLAAVAFQRLVPHRARPASTPPGEEVAAGELAANFDLQDFDGMWCRSRPCVARWSSSTYGRPGAGPAAKKCPRWRRCTTTFKNNKDFVMLAVSQDTKGKSAVVPYVEKNGYHFRDPARSRKQSRRFLQRQRRARDLHHRSQRPHRRASYGGVRLVAPRRAARRSSNCCTAKEG